MKKSILISAGLAILLLSGCGDKEEIQADVQDKASEVTKQVVNEVKSADEQSNTIEADVKNESAEVTQEVVDEIKSDDAKSEEIKSDIKDSAEQSNEDIVKDIEEKSDEIKKDVEKLSQNTESGEQIYIARCKQCHGVDGKTPALTKSLPIAGWDSAKVLESLKGYKAGNLNHYGLGGTMKGILMPLNEEQMQKVADYVSTLK
jgi:cytochrome c553